MKRIARTALLASAVIIPAMVMPIGGTAYAQTANRTYSIAPQDLGDALRQFATQSGRDVVFDPAIAAGKTSKGVKGSLDTQAALRQLIEGSGLTFTTTSAGFAIRSAEGNAFAGADSASSTGEGAAASDHFGISEILVVGSRSQNVDIRRSKDDPQPYVVFDRNDIQRSQATSLEDFLRRSVPMNAVAGSNAQSSTSVQGNVSQVNLRGLGASQTLILVDGRRAPRVGLGSGTSIAQADINGIPLEAIDRIEILPSTAGGIYGGGAVGGVINIIRRHDYRGLVMSLTADGAFSGGAETVRAGVTGGFAIEGGRTQVDFSLSQTRGKSLLVGDNHLWRAGRSLYVANDPAQNAFAGFTPNIRSLTGANLVLDGGTALGANHTFVPVGYSGTAGDGGAALVGNAGQYNTELSPDVFGEDATLLPNLRIRSANINVRRSFGKDLDAFIEIGGFENSTKSRGLQVGGSTILAAGAPNNPFQQDIQVYFPVPTLDRTQRVKSTSISATGGLIGRLGRGWTGYLEYSWSGSRFNATAAESSISESANTLLSTGGLDVVRDLNQFPIDFSPYFIDTPNNINGPTRIDQHDVSARLTGSPVRLPGGKLAVTMLAAHRNEIGGEARNEGLHGTFLIPKRSQSVNSVYAEARAPLVGQAQGIPFLQELELQATIRYDDYRTTAPTPSSAFLVTPDSVVPDFENEHTSMDSVDFTVAGKATLVPGLSLRGSYGTGFLPPAISQVTSARRRTFSLFVFDPRRGNTRLGTAGPFDRITEGNPDLKAEQSKSLSLGTIFEPTFLRGARFSVDYTRIQKRGEIIQPSAAFIVANEDIFPDRVVRGPRLPTDPANWAGPIIELNTSLLNNAKSKISAFDFQLSYEFTMSPLGAVRLYAIATYQDSLKRQLLSTSLPYESVGFADGPLEWRGNGGVNIRHGNWEADWNLQYYDGYSVRFGNPAAAPSSNLFETLQGSANVPSQIYNDVSLKYTFPDTATPAFRGLEIAAGVRNVFKARPPVIASLLMGYSQYGDPRLRSFSLSVRKAFGW